jgi:hypothetical protein
LEAFSHQVLGTPLDGGARLLITASKSVTTMSPAPRRLSVALRAIPQALASGLSASQDSCYSFSTGSSPILQHGLYPLLQSVSHCELLHTRDTPHPSTAIDCDSLRRLPPSHSQSAHTFSTSTSLKSSSCYPPWPGSTSSMPPLLLEQPWTGSAYAI